MATNNVLGCFQLLATAAVCAYCCAPRQPRQVVVVEKTVVPTGASAEKAATGAAGSMNGKQQLPLIGVALMDR
jgi:hypothetical protein